MLLVRKVRFYVTCFALLSMMLSIDATDAARDIRKNQFQKEWHEWCNAAKHELSDLVVFDASAEYLDKQIAADGVDFIKFVSVRVPYITAGDPEITIKEVREGVTSLRVSYESGLRIEAAPMMRNPIHNVFERLVPELSEAVNAYVVEKYGSLEGFTTSHFGKGPDFVRLRFEGHKFTTADIDCSTVNLDETLKKIPMIMAAANADYAAAKAGEDVTYWSENEVPGIVTRQQEQFAAGEHGIRVLWQGEFIDADDIYQVIISFGIEDQDRYDRLGQLLAHPPVD